MINRDELHKRLLEAFELLRSLGLIHTQSDLCEPMGMNPQNLNAAFQNRGRVLTSNKLGKLADAYPDVLNREYMIDGIGQIKRLSNIKVETTETISKEKTIPFYDAETTGGYEGQVSDSNTATQLVGYIQPGGWFDGRETAAIRHVGDSMIEYPNGCILAVREVTERHLLVPGKNYVVETSEYRVTKRVQRGSSPKSIALYSTNKEKYEDGRLVYEPFEVEFSDIRRIFSVLGYIVNQSGEYRLINPQ